MRRIVVKRSTYLDSVSLMRISRKVNEIEGITFAMAAMATDTNLRLLEEAGFGLEGAGGATAGDLLVAIEAGDPAALDAGFSLVTAEIERGTSAEPEAGHVARDLTSTLEENADINLVLISVPGRYAAYEARKAIEAGKHVMIFSDNVSVEAERNLKTLAGRKGLLLMGPDCGTAIINGVGLGFANRVPRGDIGIVAASGTGAQEVSSILARRYGRGISQLIGTGGRDISREIGGIMMKMGLEALIGDVRTRAIVVISKLPDREVAAEIAALARKGRKPCVIHFAGQGRALREGDLAFTRTLAETAREAARAVGAGGGTPPDAINHEIAKEAAKASSRLPRSRKFLRGLYSGGTLAQEAMFLLGPVLGEIHTNMKIGDFPVLADPIRSAGHTIVDLGDDVFTRGRAHPMIDQAYRLGRLAREVADPQVRVILLDVVLGYGCSEAPGVEISGALGDAWGPAGKKGGRPVVIAGICGTNEDPQGYSLQRDALESAGVLVAESNEQACELVLRAMRTD